MVFETEKKAQNFMKFNNQNFDTDVVPVRAYYCSACGGWHVTKRKTWNTKKEDPLDKLVKAYKVATTKKKKKEKVPNLRTREEILAIQGQKAALYQVAYKKVCDLRYRLSHEREKVNPEDIKEVMDSVSEVELFSNKTYYGKKTSQLRVNIDDLWYETTYFYSMRVEAALARENDQTTLTEMKSKLLRWIGLQSEDTIIRSTKYSDLKKDIQTLLGRIDGKINN